ncbi:MAG: alkaline phosphatase family protein [Rikenellaceae bacterium]
MKRGILIILVALGVVSQLFGQESTSSSPRLVINLVVGSMRAGDVERYRGNLSSGGLVRMTDSGVNFLNAQYKAQQTVTPVSLSTLATGATPAVHGVIGYGWWDYVVGKRVYLLNDPEERIVEYHTDGQGVSAHRLLAPTVTEMLRGAKPKSKSVTIAIEPSSAIPFNGAVGDTYWMDERTCEWSSSTAYMSKLPEWVRLFNKTQLTEKTVNMQWSSMLNHDFYYNTFCSNLSKRSISNKYEGEEIAKGRTQAESRKNLYQVISSTPEGNSAIFKFAREAVRCMDLGSDESVDLINIYLDPSRNITQLYGVTSVEVEDMFYRLDRDLAEFLEYVTIYLKAQEICVIVTSDHGSSPSYGLAAEPKGRFNTEQFVVIVNSFLRAKYGGEKWVLGYENRNLYLNHKLLYEKKLSIAEVQNEVASFAMQFRGVAHALTATALRSGYFSDGYGALMQRSFYPQRSGDVILNLQPGWIELGGARRSESGSTYRYDSHVPLMIYGEGVVAASGVERAVMMEDLAPTLARIMGIEIPIAAEGQPIPEVVE